MILASIISNAGGAAAAASNAHPGTYPGAPSSIWVGLAVPLGLLAIGLVGLACQRVCDAIGPDTTDNEVPSLYTKCRTLGLFIDKAEYVNIHGRFFKVFQIHIITEPSLRVMFEDRRPSKAYAEAHAWVDQYAMEL